jgi:hypothetical protein
VRKSDLEAGSPIVRHFRYIVLSERAALLPREGALALEEVAFAYPRQPRPALSELLDA